MQFSRTFLLLLAFIAAFSTGCRKDNIKDSEVVSPPEPIIEIPTGVYGLVVDEGGTPVEGAEIHLGSSQAKSDENGIFSLSGLANQAQPFVRVEKSGYLPSLASFSTKAGDKGRVKVTLRAKILTAQINASAGGIANVPGGGSIEFAANGFVDAAGQAYNGPVLVYATYLDPTQPQTETMIPASWQGRNAAGEAQILLSYGMIHALLETPSGDQLQISKPAQITVPVPASRLASAPAEIPLWYIDEATSLWKEDGSAVLQGSVYKGQVSHFSWWNCDLGFPVVQLSGILRIGSTYPFAIIRITRPNGAFATTSTSATGFFSGQVPANEALLFEVLNECGNVVYTQNIGPFAVDTDLGIISVSWTTDWVEISGTLLNCDQNPVTKGYVSAHTNAQAQGNFPIQINPVDGSFSGTITNCGGTEVSLVGYDLDALKASATQTKPVSPQVNFGNVVACDNQILPGILIEFGNGNLKFIDNATVTIDSTGGGGAPSYYRILALDDQGNGHKVQYSINLLDWNQNPSNPLWATSIDVQLFNQPVYYIFGGGDVELIQQATQPGELVIFKITNSTLTEYPSNTNYPNSTITITAILQ